MPSTTPTSRASTRKRPSRPRTGRWATDADRAKNEPVYEPAEIVGYRPDQTREAADRARRPRLSSS